MRATSRFQLLSLRMDACTTNLCSAPWMPSSLSTKSSGAPTCTAAEPLTLAEQGEREGEDEGEVATLTQKWCSKHLRRRMGNEQCTRFKALRSCPPEAAPLSLWSHADHRR